MTAADKPFWEKPLEQLSCKEWESLCDGCGRCCLVKLEDEDTGDIHHTDIGCELFRAETCRCRDYRRRASRVADCVTLTPEGARTIRWLPPTCAYRLRAQGKPLMWWHPLVSGDPETVHSAGVSARGRVFALENELALEDYPTRIVAWPRRMPAAARRKPKG
jgi:uncharacterized cysteine cluster protein YcgN (CxxCxxCC family)